MMSLALGAAMTAIEMARPFEVDSEEYPFKDHWLSYRDGYVHYIDEGEGPAVLLLHGNPTWSFLYRDVIKELHGECRLIALDYPGFGMSKAPSDYGFTPQEHAEVVEDFIRHLDLKDFILVVQDWGGPIGMSYAVRNKENLRGLVVMNTWAWPATPSMSAFSIAMGGWPVGYWLQTRLNYFARILVPKGIFNAEKITESLRRAYTDPFPTPASRIPTWIFPGQIRMAGSWLAETESKLSDLSDLPAQILWGIQDPVYSTRNMTARWQGYLKNSELELLDDASHYLQEDRPDRVAANIRRVLERTKMK